jgi:hypothetical protein
MAYTVVKFYCKDIKMMVNKKVKKSIEKQKRSKDITEKAASCKRGRL